MVDAPVSVLIEAKTTRRGALFAVRDALGQLLEYRHFLGPKRAALCILLDCNPGELLLEFVEQELSFLVLWTSGEELVAGPQTARTLTDIGVPTATHADKRA